jgi:hypothetical protein
VEVSPTLISNVTDAVLEDVRAWQSRHRSGAVKDHGNVGIAGVDLVWLSFSWGDE